ncbi:hypothetical protein FACS1894125_3320 [Actinomycetota bacterium]|nr:hypothetical protein FACS1894125_3320 [Actinomycetota bacterium]
MCYNIDMTSAVMEQKGTPVYDEYVAGGGSLCGNFAPLFEGQLNFHEIVENRIAMSYDRSRHIPAEVAFQGWRDKVAEYYG